MLSGVIMDLSGSVPIPGALTVVQNATVDDCGTADPEIVNRSESASDSLTACQLRSYLWLAQIMGEPNLMASPTPTIPVRHVCVNLSTAN
jgi:hypothetical protein